MIGNGLGPWWFPAWLRRALTAWSAARFPSLAWELHDASYAIGRPERWRCDRGLRRAMQADARAAKRWHRRAFLSAAAWFFWVLVRLFGWASYGRKR